MSPRRLQQLGLAKKNANAMEIGAVNNSLKLTDKFALNENFTCRLTFIERKVNLMQISSMYMARSGLNS